MQRRPCVPTALVSLRIGQVLLTRFCLARGPRARSSARSQQIETADVECSHQGRQRNWSWRASPLSHRSVDPEAVRDGLRCVAARNQLCPNLVGSSCRFDAGRRGCLGADELHSTAVSYRAIITTLTDDDWRGSAVEPVLGAGECFCSLCQFVDEHELIGDLGVTPPSVRFDQLPDLRRRGMITAS